MVFCSNMSLFFFVEVFLNVIIKLLELVFSFILIVLDELAVICFFPLSLLSFQFSFLILVILFKKER